LESGQVLAVTGPNGQGKSTLLKLAAGLLEPSEGSFSGNAPWAYAALDLALYPQLTAQEHLEWAADLAGTPLDTGASLARVGLEGTENRLASAMSTGMRVRLKLALALVSNPKVLMLDEPTAALDEQGQVLVRALVKGLVENGGAILMATNDRADLEFATHELALD
jgi:ABC-type multidrug transport system ATPase subunit